MAPLVAEAENKTLPMVALMVACLIGSISSVSLKQMRSKGTEEECLP